MGSEGDARVLGSMRRKYDWVCSEGLGIKQGEFACGALGHPSCETWLAKKKKDNH